LYTVQYSANINTLRIHNFLGEGSPGTLHVDEQNVKSKVISTGLENITGRKKSKFQLHATVTTLNAQSPRTINQMHGAVEQRPSNGFSS
jgi:hypothetical protein